MSESWQLINLAATNVKFDQVDQLNSLVPDLQSLQISHYQDLQRQELAEIIREYCYLCLLDVELFQFLELADGPR